VVSGRAFVSCSKGPTDGGCKFFEWEDQQTATTTGEPRDPSPARPMETAYAAPAFAAGESDVLCRCNIPSVTKKNFFYFILLKFII